MKNGGMLCKNGVLSLDVAMGWQTSSCFLLPDVKGDDSDFPFEFDPSCFFSVA